MHGVESYSGYRWGNARQAWPRTAGCSREETGTARQARLGAERWGAVYRVLAKRGMVLHGKARQAMQGVSRFGLFGKRADRHGSAWQGRHGRLGRFWSGPDRIGSFRHGRARQAWKVTSRRGCASHIQDGHGKAGGVLFVASRHSPVRIGMARQARLGWSQWVPARTGKAGMVRIGTVRSVQAGQGKAGK